MSGLGRLAQGVETRMPTINNTVTFVHTSTIPVHKRITYDFLMVYNCPNKAEKYRIRPTVGGDKLEFTGDSSSVAALSISSAKLLLNSTVSTDEVFFINVDTNDFSIDIFFLTPTI